MIDPAPAVIDPVDHDDTTLATVARAYAETIRTAVTREYPNQTQHTMTGPTDRPAPREIHPAFYGCFDWHSAVHMHWSLVRLLRSVPDAVQATATRAVLDAHLTEGALAAEAAYLANHPGFERPYGWGWTLTLAHELATWDDPDAARWSAAMRPLADTVVGHYLRWLSSATYPIRVGTHGNSAFGLTRALPYARLLAAGPTGAEPEGGALLDAIGATARRWYGSDADYPAGWEPGGSDFLSPALTGAELLAEVLPAVEFGGWLEAYLPGLATGVPVALFTPAVVTDSTDGQIAHLHGLNLYRAHAFRRLAAVLPAGDARTDPMLAAARRHAHASLPAVTGEDYMVEHWLASFAVMLLT